MLNPSKQSQIKFKPLPDQPIDLKGLAPLSKSISHRHLFLHYLYKADLPVDFTVSDSRDTRLFQVALQTNEGVINLEDAGTPARFSLVFHAIKKHNVTITGNISLQQRSIRDLVDTLTTQGAKIVYLNKTGFFPVRIEQGIQGSFNDVWYLNTNESSQFASALLLAMSLYNPAPKLHINGLTHSWSYIHLTASTLNQWGFSVLTDPPFVSIEGSPLTAVKPKIEIDWGSVSFLYLTCLFTRKSIKIHHAYDHSSQADFAAVAQFQTLGIRSEFQNQFGILSLTFESTLTSDGLIINAANFPDLVPALCSAYAMRGIDVIFSQIGNLKTKESDRIHSLRTNLHKLGCEFIEEDSETYRLISSNAEWPESFNIETFNDHRIAMSFAPWAAVIKNVSIDDTKCVEKSFPNFWEAFKKCNFELSEYDIEL